MYRKHVLRKWWILLPGIIIVVALLFSGVLPEAKVGETVIQAATPDSDPIFAKYEGIDGEALDTNHQNWIHIDTLNWGVSQSQTGTSSLSRRRGSVEVEDLVITFNYEKAAPKLLEKCVKGSAIPKLEIEFVNSFPDSAGTQTYLRYELKNVMVTSYHVESTDPEGPTVIVGNNFEDIKVTYTEYDENGNNQGNVETEFKVEKGE